MASRKPCGVDIPATATTIDALTDYVTLINTSMCAQTGCKKNLASITCNGQVLTYKNAPSHFQMLFFLPLCRKNDNDFYCELSPLKYIILGLCGVSTIIAIQNSPPQNHTSSFCHKNAGSAHAYGSTVCLCRAARTPAAHHQV